MTNMCDDREKLIAYLYDEADASERRQVEAHLSDCAECRDEIRGFRGVRQDLLSWDVPEHESVWKPFVTPAATAWWKQVPAWGLAAAATLVFGIGFAGGFAGRALAAAPVTSQAQLQPVQQMPTAAPQTVAATPEQIQALESRLASLERTSATEKPATIANVANTSVDAATLKRFEQLLKDAEGRINQRTAQKLYSQMLDMANQHERDRAWVTQQINEAQAQTYGNLARVANRGSIEKEKER